MENITLASPIDMEVGPDGKIYILEYGKGWFSKNPGAGLSRIDYFLGKLPNEAVVKRGNGRQDAESTFEDLDKAGADLRHKEGEDLPTGQSLILASDCQSCHAEDKASIGPSYKDIAKRYHDKPNALDALTKKIIKGGSGVWGEVAMPAHPEMNEVDAKEIVKWILSL